MPHVRLVGREDRIVVCCFRDELDQMHARGGAHWADHIAHLSELHGLQKKLWIALWRLVTHQAAQGALGAF